MTRRTGVPYAHCSACGKPIWRETSVARHYGKTYHPSCWKQVHSTLTKSGEVRLRQTKLAKHARWRKSHGFY